ncbi:shikimate kinase [Paucidesulfovibrio gracilis DSM 16080]|uniref:Shikimate kinase n=1 Tax=Paucidesulfovibrio gracilis DSM 16080 TaxID=1121449 RepID=A0A1T4X189_9BACT|nr:homoserine kinase [Paucidesulfovibrio gracilis]SKA83413.1 shikimate kinase [Paucidesulfovibrio gracilis DSM 16080]
MPETDIETRCVTLVGIAGAGKSTVGRLLANELNWAHVDTDQLLEAYYAMPLQDLLDSVGLEKFLELEEHQVANLGIQRCIVSTGGSVVYGSRAVERIRSLGPVVHLHVEPETFAARVDAAPNRGLAIGGKTKAELHAERLPLYRHASDVEFATDTPAPEETVRQILHWLDAEHQIRPSR